ncbi:Zn(2)-C6 fungal-type domain-containing protein [[Candida] zeylanoides]
MNENSKRKRLRVPVSCLVCKRRKVKCDKVKPACGGCVKNGVPHLCEYVDPYWSNRQAPESAAGAGTAAVVAAHKSDDHLKTIEKQRKEIEDLKRRLALAQQENQYMAKTHGLQFSGTVALTATGGRQERPKALEPVGLPLTILKKLGPTRKQRITVEDDVILTSKRQYRNFVDIYSWLNVLRLDPQLMSLWYKIVNLQKIYQLHKSSLATDDSGFAGAPHLMSQRGHQPTQLPLLASSGPKCPVMQVNFNALATQTATSTASATVSEDIGGPSTPPAPPTAKSSTDAAFEAYHDLSDKSVTVMTATQQLWKSTKSSSREQQMTYTQMTFLLEYYFTNNDSSAECNKLMVFYRDKISRLITKDAESDAAILGNDFENVEGMAEGTKFFRLKAKGVYLCMLTLVVQEALALLRAKLVTTARSGGGHDADIENFKQLFPAELETPFIEHEESEPCVLVREFLTGTIKIKLKYDPEEVDFTQNIPYLACCVFSMNYSISHFGGIVTNTSKSSSLASVFPEFLKSILSPENLAIWTDPECLTVSDASTAKRAIELQSHMCIMWMETIRLINVVTFSVVPLIKVSESVGDMIIEVLERIDDSEQNRYHTDFISKTPFVSSFVSFGSSFLITRIFNTLSGAIHGAKVDTENLKSLSIECAVWLNSHTESLRVIEDQLMLHYLRFYLSYIVMVQEEVSERGKHNSDAARYSSIVTKYCSMVTYLRKVSARLATNQLYARYISSMMTGVLTRVVPVISGVMLRLGDLFDSTGAENSKLCAIVDQYFSRETGQSEPNLKLMAITSSIIDELRASVSWKEDRVAALSKVWNFYMVFIKNLHKINLADYSKLHVDIPAFKSEGSCPARSLPDNQDVSVKPSGCPIDHASMKEAGTTLTKFHTMNLSNGGRCPVDYKSLSSGDLMMGSGTCPIEGMVTKSTKKRKCPFDHESLSNHVVNGRVSAKESNVRGGSHSPSPISRPETPLQALSQTSKRLLEPKPLISPAVRQDSIPSGGVNEVSSPMEEGGFLSEILTDFADFDFGLELDFSMLHGDLIDATPIQ